MGCKCLFTSLLHLQSTSFILSSFKFSCLPYFSSVDSDQLISQRLWSVPPILPADRHCAHYNFLNIVLYCIDRSLPLTYVSHASQQTDLASEHSLWPALSFGTICWLLHEPTRRTVCFKRALKTLLCQWVDVLLQKSAPLRNCSGSGGRGYSKDYNIDINGETRLEIKERTRLLRWDLGSTSLPVCCVTTWLFVALGCRLNTTVNNWKHRSRHQMPTTTQIRVQAPGCIPPKKPTEFSG